MAEQQQQQIEVPDDKGWRSRTAQLTLGVVAVPFVMSCVLVFVGKLTGDQWITMAGTTMTTALTGLGIYGGKRVLDKFAAAALVKAGNGK